MLSVNGIRFFGEYRLEKSPMVLYRGMEIVDLPHKQLELLAALVNANGEVVTREAILDAVWRDAYVEEHNLTQTVFLLRRSLGKLPNGGDYVETVHRRGYRMSAAALSAGNHTVAAEKEDRGRQVLLRRDPVQPGAQWWRSAMQLAPRWLWKF